MRYTEIIRQKLEAAFSPQVLEVRDDSGRHVGHAGSRPGGQTHFHVRIVTRAFEGVARIERQRRIHAVLADELKQQIHALTLSALTPDEAAR
jgi:BolA protein